MGETGDSGHRPGWDRRGKMTTFPNEFAESWGVIPENEIRAENGRVSDAGMLLKRKDTKPNDNIWEYS